MFPHSVSQSHIAIILTIRWLFDLFLGDIQREAVKQISEKILQEDTKSSNWKNRTKCGGATKSENDDLWGAKLLASKSNNQSCWWSDCLAKRFSFNCFVSHSEKKLFALFIDSVIYLGSKQLFAPFISTLQLSQNILCLTSGCKNATNITVI